MKNIRNFAIIAHVDHGKSTLADRLLELTGVVDKDRHDDQLLDRNPISRERGITIKLAPVRMSYTVNGEEYVLNLIDTPGHVDFSYEVERTLASVEGVVLLIDATQGIQAQTIAHTYKAIGQNLVIIPVLNKIDMILAQVDEVEAEVCRFIGCKPSDIYKISAKTGQGVPELLEGIIEKIPAPQVYGEKEKPRALIFDSYYDNFKGVIAFVRVFEGRLHKGQTVRMCASGSDFVVDEVGKFTPDLVAQESLENGQIGYVVTKLKDIHSVQVGDTLVLKNSTDEALPGYRKNQPMVFSSLFPTDPDDFLSLKYALEKLSLNDSSLSYEPIHSQALGSGFRAGFLGLLHADVVRQRLENEFNLSIVLTAPTVEYKIHTDDKGRIVYEEPVALITIVSPSEYIGTIMKLCEESRGTFVTMDSGSQVYVTYEIPLAELIRDFFDDLKSRSSGYASLQWEFKEYREVEADKMDIMLNNEVVEEFSEYVVTDRAFERGRDLTSRLKDLIPRQQYEVRIQARYQGKVIASSRISPFRKDVTAKLYGGDRTRKDKLLDKQKKGKKKMKQIGSVEVPKEVFFKVFRKN